MIYGVQRSSFLNEFSYFLPVLQSSPTIIKVEGHRQKGNILYLYVRNLGSKETIITDVYVIDCHGKIHKATYSIASDATVSEVWGGDVWSFDSYKLSIVLRKSGKIIYDTFTTPNTNLWDQYYVNYNNIWSAVYFDPDGLKLLSQSAGGWAVRGIITINKVIDLQNLPVVIEVDLQKTNYNIPSYRYGDAAASPFAACLYLSSVKERDPYYATPWFAVKLYPRPQAYPNRTEAQLVTRDASGVIAVYTLYTWNSSPNSEPRGIFLLIFNESNKVYYYFWKDSRNVTPYKSGSWTSSGLSQVFSSSPLYIYLTIDNRVTVSSRKVHVRYLQVYKGTRITVINVSPGWTIELVDENGNIIEVNGVKYFKVAKSNIVEFDLLPYIIKYGMPLKGRIIVKTYNATEYNAVGGWPIKPNSVKVLTIPLQNIPSGICKVKLVTKDGTEVVYSFRKT